MSDVRDIRLFGTVEDSIVDGPGLRYAVFVQGCSHRCPGCHNPESHDPAGGELRAIDELVDEIAANGLITGVTLTGGDPFDQVEASAELAHRIKAAGLNLWTYTGYTYEELVARAESDPATRQLLEATDVLVDGPFIEAQKSLLLPWRGSANQRVIDLTATRRTGNVVEWSDSFAVPSKPPSW